MGVVYDGPLYTFFDPHDGDKSVVVGIETDDEGELYLAFHIEGHPVLRNAIYGKRFGKHKKDESAGKKDKRTFMYLSRPAMLELYDLLGHILDGEIDREETLAQDMENPAHNDGVSVNDLLSALEDDK